MLSRVNGAVLELLWLIWKAVSWVVWLLLAVIRPAVRFVSAVLLIAAIMTLTADVTRWQTGEWEPLFHSLAQQMQLAAPATFKGFARSVSQALHPLVWTYGVLPVLLLPAWLLFAVLAVLVALSGREPKRVNVFIN